MSLFLTYSVSLQINLLFVSCPVQLFNINDFQIVFYDTVIQARRWSVLHSVQISSDRLAAISDHQGQIVKPVRKYFKIQHLEQLVYCVSKMQDPLHKVPTYFPKLLFPHTSG